MNLKLREKNQRVTLLRSSDHRNCSDAQYFLDSDGAWQYCHVSYWSNHADRRNEIFPARRREGNDADRRRHRHADLENEKTQNGFGDRLCYGRHHYRIRAESAGSCRSGALRSQCRAIMTVAISVGLFLALAIVRIRYKISLSLLLTICYAALILELQISYRIRTKIWAKNILWRAQRRNRKDIERTL